MTTRLDCIRLLTEARPVALNRCDAAFRSRVLQQASKTPLRRTEHARSWRRVAPVGIVLLAGCLAAVLALEAASPGVKPRTAPLSARSVLLLAAQHVVAAPAAKSGRYWHWSIESSTGLLTQQRWIARAPGDRSWFWFSFRGQRGGQLHEAAPGDWGQQRFDIEGRELTFAQVAALPSETTELRAFLLAPYPSAYRDGNPAQLVQRLFGEAASLALMPAAPAVRAAAYRIIAGYSGVVAVGRVRDALGRLGTAVAVFDGDVEHQLIIDPTTGAVMDLQDVQHAGASSRIIDYQAILESGWTNSIHP